MTMKFLQFVRHPPRRAASLRAPLRSCLRASALLVSLLLMTFLVVVGLGMSRLVVDALRVERNVVEAGKAYFAAEGGVEFVLYQREQHVPGYEVQDDPSVSTSSYAFANAATVAYAMTAVENQVPCAHRDSEWRALKVQESVLWPLYRWDSDARHVDLDHFTLTFEVDRSEGAYNGVEGSVLRWKILGIDNAPGAGHTEAISGLLDYGSSPVPLTADDTANFYDGAPGGTFVNYEAYAIFTFLQDHTFNTLILTNVLDLSAQDSSVQDASENVLQLQLSTAEGSPCEYTLIQSDGQSRDNRQTIDAQVKLDSFLPVFNFVLYHTDSS